MKGLTIIGAAATMAITAGVLNYAGDPGYTNGTAYVHKGPGPLKTWVHEAHGIEKQLRAAMPRYR